MSDVSEYTGRRFVELMQMPKDQMTKLRLDVGEAAFFKAIGYLSTWALDSGRYDKVTISFWLPKDWPPEISAVYYEADGRVGYTLHGVFNSIEKGFTFHS